MHLIAWGVRLTAGGAAFVPFTSFHTGGMFAPTGWTLKKKQKHVEKHIWVQFFGDEILLWPQEVPCHVEWVSSWCLFVNHTLPRKVEGCKGVTVNEETEGEQNIFPNYILGAPKQVQIAWYNCNVLIFSSKTLVIFAVELWTPHNQSQGVLCRFGVKSNMDPIKIIIIRLRSQDMINLILPVLPHSFVLANFGTSGSKWEVITWVTNQNNYLI